MKSAFNMLVHVYWFSKELNTHTKGETDWGRKIFNSKYSAIYRGVSEGEKIELLIKLGKNSMSLVILKTELYQKSFTDVQFQE